ncbi:hypothetical protein YC2023_091744 [Brassica napus]
MGYVEKTLCFSPTVPYSYKGRKKYKNPKYQPKIKALINKSNTSIYKNCHKRQQNVLTRTAHGVIHKSCVYPQSLSVSPINSGLWSNLICHGELIQGEKGRGLRTKRLRLIVQAAKHGLEMRRSNTKYHKPCMFFCQKCCTKCLCVYPGTYGNKQGGSINREKPIYYFN